MSTSQMEAVAEYMAGLRDWCLNLKKTEKGGFIHLFLFETSDFKKTKYKNILLLNNHTNAIKWFFHSFWI